MKTYLKHLVHVSLISLMFAVSLVSCDGDVSSEDSSVYLENLSQTVAFEASPEGKETFNVESNSEWTITKSDLDWLEINPMRSLGGSCEVTMTAVENKTNYERKGEMTISCGSYSKTVDVIQTAGIIRGEILFSGLTDNTISFVCAEAESEEFSLSSNLAWTVELQNLDWCAVSPVEGKRNRSATITVVPSNNETIHPREGNLVFRCSDGSVFTVQVIQDPFIAELTVSESSMFCMSNGYFSSNIIKLFANAEWTSSVDAPWVTLDKISGESGDSEVAVSAEAYSGNSSRTAKVEFSNRGKTVELTVVQVPGYLTVNPESVALSGDGKAGVESGGNVISITSNASWTALASEDWISISPASGMSDGLLTVTATANEGGSRDGTVRLDVGGAYRNVKVSQEMDMTGYIDISTALVWPCSPTKDEVALISPDWLSEGKALPSANADLAYAQWTTAEGNASIGYSTLFVIASNGNLTLRHCFTDDCLILFIPVAYVRAGQNIVFDFQIQPMANQPMYWSADINLDGTWKAMDTGGTYKTPSLGTSANIELSSAKAFPIVAVFPVQEDIVKQEIMLRVRVADGTYWVNKTINSAPVTTKSTSLRFMGNAYSGLAVYLK